MGLFGPPNVERLASRKNTNGLIKALAYRKAWNIRKAAAEALGAMADKRAIPALVGALHDEDKDVRRSAADALHTLGWQPTPDAVGVHYRIIRKEWKECAAIGEPAVEPLIAVLLGEDWADSRAAAEALGAIGDCRAVAPLFAALKKYGWGIIGSDVAEALSRIGVPAVTDLIGILADGDADARLAAVSALGAIGDPRAVQPLFSALRGPDLHVCESAARALGRIGEPAVELLIRALKDSEVPWEAARALGEIADPRAVQPLIDSFAQTHWMIRDAAVAALGRIGEPSIAPLLSALQDPDRDVRRCAADALDRLDWKPREDEAGAYYWIAKNQWMNCVEIGAPAVDPLIIVLSDPHPEVRRAAAATLGILGDEAALESLLAALRDDDGLVIAAAAEALGCLKDRRALEPLLDVLRNPHWQARAAAAEALGRIRLSAAVEPLLTALPDDSSHVREAIVEALGYLGDHRAVEALIEALGHGDEDVHRAAAEALGRLGDRRAVPVLQMVLDPDLRSRPARVPRRSSRPCGIPAPGTT
jgi:HEAT repeat protein